MQRNLVTGQSEHGACVQYYGCMESNAQAFILYQLTTVCWHVCVRLVSMSNTVLDVLSGFD